MATIYTKKGNKNWKEKKYIKKLNEYIESETVKDPNFQFKPCDTFEELQSAFDTHCVEDVEFSETKNNLSSTSDNQSGSDNVVEHKLDATTEQTPSSTTPSGRMTAPFSQQEPMVRDYVLTDGLDGERGPIHNSGKTTFEEPVNFGESFVLPNETPNNNSAGQNQNSSKNQQPQNNSGQPSQNQQSQQQDGDVAAKQKRSTKRFAKSIVKLVCKLAEKGFVWYANRDITEEKLLEYELSGEMDLTLLVSLGEQELPVKQFFQIQRLRAEELAKYTPEEISDLSDSLADYLAEKNIKPTPGMQFLVDAGSVIGGKVVELIDIKMGTASVLTQLRNMQAESNGQGSTQQNTSEKREYKEPQHEIEKQIEAKAAQSTSVSSEPAATVDIPELTEDTAEQALIDGKTIETKE